MQKFKKRKIVVANIQSSSSSCFEERPAAVGVKIFIVRKIRKRHLLLHYSEASENGGAINRLPSAVWTTTTVVVKGKELSPEATEIERRTQGLQEYTLSLSSKARGKHIDLKSANCISGIDIVFTARQPKPSQPLDIRKTYKADTGRHKSRLVEVRDRLPHFFADEDSLAA